MATKKITLNELRSLVKQIIKEQIIPNEESDSDFVKFSKMVGRNIGNLANNNFPFRVIDQDTINIIFELDVNGTVCELTISPIDQDTLKYKISYLVYGEGKKEETKTVSIPWFEIFKNNKFRDIEKIQSYFFNICGEILKKRILSGGYGKIESVLTKSEIKKYIENNEPFTDTFINKFDYRLKQ